MPLAEKSTVFWWMNCIHPTQNPPVGNAVKKENLIHTVHDETVRITKKAVTRGLANLTTTASRLSVQGDGVGSGKAP